MITIDISKLESLGIEVIVQNDQIRFTPINRNQAFARTGRKTIGGHGHSPCIVKGSTQVGVHAMGMAYAKGYSNWMIADALIYPSGKNTLVFAVKGQYSPMMREWFGL